MYFSFCTWVAVTSMKSIFGAVCTIDCSQTRDKNNVLIIWKFVLKVCMNKFKKSFLLNSCPVPKGLNTNVTTMLNILQVIFTIPKVTTFKCKSCHFSILPYQKFITQTIPKICSLTLYCQSSCEKSTHPAAHPHKPIICKYLWGWLCTTVGFFVHTLGLNK